MDELIYTRIILRNDSTSAWLTNKDQILEKGEVGIEFLTDGTAKMKIGDGEKTWEELSYFGGTEAQIFEVTLNTEETHDAAITRIVGNAKVVAGDIVIVKEAIDADATKHSYTAYVRTAAGAWAVMDGNVSAENVYFSEDLITSFAMGNVSLNNGAATISAAGKNLKEVWDTIYLKETNTNLQNTVPSVTVSGNSTKYYLVGQTSEAQTLTLGLSKGKYDYGYGYVESKDETDPAAGTKAKVVVTNDGTGVVAVAENPYTLTFDGTAVTPTATNGNKFVCAAQTKTTAPASSIAKYKVKYEKAGNPVSNLGNIYPAQAYSDGNSSEKSATLSCWYYPIYSGFTYDDGTNGTAVVNGGFTAERVQKFTAIVGADAYNKTKVTSATATKAWREYVYAFPAGYNWTMSGAKDGNNIDCTVQHTTVDISFTGVTDPVKYDVYYIYNAEAYGTLGISWTI